MTTRFFVRSLLGLALLATSSQFALAQVPGNSGLPSGIIATFVANPSQLLSQFPNGGPGLTSRTRDLLTSDRTTRTVLIGLLQTANEDQRRAIAAGLAQAAKIYARTDQKEATEIQEAVAKTGLSDVVLAYANAGGDTGTASTAGGGGGGSGSGGPTGGGASTGGTSGFAAPFGTNFAGNTSGNLLTGAGVGGIGQASSVSTY